MSNDALAHAALSDAGFSDDRVVFVHAHPDDETISTGGTIATLVDRGATVTVVTCTRGERGEIIPDDLRSLEGDEDALAAHRETELAAAMLALGVTDHRWLGSTDARMAGREPRRYRDSGMVWGPDGPERVAELADDALCAAEFGEVASDIATVISTTGANAVVSYDENGGYGHPDHVMAHEAARRAARVLSVPFYAIEPAGSTREPNLRVDVAPVLARKVAALRAHRSQLTVDGDRIVLPGGQVEPIASVERFHRLDDHRPIVPSWSDSGAGARVLACAVALLAGISVGALATVIHQTDGSILGADLPLGLVAGLAVIAAVLAGLRLVFDNRIMPGFAALGILGAIGLLSFESAGGSVLIPDNLLGNVWVYGPVFIAALVLAWPSLGRAERRRIGVRQGPKGHPAP